MTVIRVENLTKEYRLGTISHGTLKEDLQSWWARLRGKEDPNSIVSPHSSFNPQQDSTHPSSLNPQRAGLNPHFLALDNVSFDVKLGEAVGIIGRNGAGKSTLLKILSRVTAPTSGVVKIKGKVASLLEVGTGFHPELTGRENIFLNGTILGMKRAEIQRKFDEIVAFAEIEQFIDTPVKRYSSGMYVRLAFAVAAHLEPEILIVDEVLAVGDIQFQKKCLGKMKEVGKEGRTVLFVSHNMGAVRSLCSNGILLENGQCTYEGTSGQVVDYYLKTTATDIDNKISIKDRPRQNVPTKIILSDVRIINLTTIGSENIEALDSVAVLIDYELLSDLTYFSAEWMLRDVNGINIAHSSSSPMGNIIYYPKSKHGSIRCNIPKIPLAVGEYYLDVGLALPNIEYLDYVENACRFTIVSSDPLGTGNQYHTDKAPVYIESTWESNVNE